MMRAHAEAMERGADCEHCPLAGWREGPVLGTIRKSRLLVVGEGPTGKDIEDGELFKGQPGREVDTALRDGSTSRAHVSVTSALLCRPPGGQDLGEYLKRLPKNERDPRKCCAPRLARDIVETEPVVIAPLGAHALEAVAAHYKVPIGKGKKKAGELRLANISAQRGHPAKIPSGPWLYPTLHPAYAIRKAKNLAHVIREDIARAAKMAIRGGGLDWPGVDVDSPFAVLRRAFDEDLLLTVDIETTGLESTSRIRCVGIGFFDPQTRRARVGVFEIENGKHDLERSKAAMRAAVRHGLRLQFHNGQFDTRVLQAQAWLPPEYTAWAEDTILAHHDSWENDCPHDLSFVSSRFVEVPLWKFDVDHKVVDELSAERFASLVRYNILDVATTIYAGEGLRKWIDRDGTRPQYRRDVRMAWKVRDMAQVGVFIDRRVQKEFHDRAESACTKLRGALQSATGVPDLNPNSGAQLAAWFFGKNGKGYVPQIATGRGRKWEEGDDAATSVPALFALLDAGVDKQTQHVIKMLVRYKSIFKLQTHVIDAIEPMDVPGEPSWLGRIVGSLSLHTTPQGRLASSDPNLYNWSKTGVFNLRKMVVAPPGYKIVGIDGDQIESRFYAGASGDKKMIEALMRKLDIHTWNAATLFPLPGETQEQAYQRLKALPKSELTPKRQFTKTFVHASTYGAEGGKKHEMIVNARDKATGDRLFPDLAGPKGEAYVAEKDALWTSEHPENAEFKATLLRMVAEHGYVATLIHGRRRWFPGNWPTKENAPASHVCSGTAADWMNDAFERVFDAYRPGADGRHSGLFAFVYDSLDAYVPEANTAKIADLLHEALNGTWRDIPITGTPTVTQSWGD